MTAFRDWLTHLWDTRQHPTLLQDYLATFQGEHGQRVLQHLLDSVYCTVYEGKDPMELAAHNARRSVVHDILVNLDMAGSPEKYRVRTEEAHGRSPARTRHA